MDIGFNGPVLSSDSGQRVRVSRIGGKFPPVYSFFMNEKVQIPTERCLFNPETDYDPMSLALSPNQLALGSSIFSSAAFCGLLNRGCLLRDLCKSAQSCRCCAIFYGLVEMYLSYMLPDSLRNPYWLLNTFSCKVEENGTLIAVHGKGIRLYRFTAYAKAQTEAAAVFGSTSHIPSNPDLCTAVALLEQWMRDCEATHPKCRSVRTPSSLPTRVLYVGSGADLRLFKSNGQDAKYMTLSYCWGKSKLGIKTTKATLQHRICGIRWSRLPKTFQDAIEITRALGIEYLWIDSLCIIQDDQEDWQRESARMADIYAGSYLNIAATSAEDSQGGCFERRYRYQKDSGTKCPADPLKLELHLQGESASLFVRPDFESAHEQVSDIPAHWNNRTSVYRWFDRRLLGIDVETLPSREDILHINPSDNTAGSPLLGRAWVYQERLLARRTIFFHHEEMVFECRSGTRCECGGIARVDKPLFSTILNGTENREILPPTVPRIKTRFFELLRRGNKMRQFADLWLETVEKYSCLKLSYETDRLPALSGLASRLAQRFGTTYIAGLWKEDLPRALLWSRESYFGETIRSAAACTPTWSWASLYFLDNSVQQAITYETVIRDTKAYTEDSRLKILDVQCYVSGANLYGRVDYGFIKVRGAVIEAKLKYRAGKHWLKCFLEYEGQKTDFRTDIGKLAEAADNFPEDMRRRMVMCLLVATFGHNEKVALVLERSNDADTYQRIGRVRIENGLQWFTSASVQTLTIV